jgi:hypothetical protein
MGAEGSLPCSHEYASQSICIKKGDLISASSNVILIYICGNVVVRVAGSRPDEAIFSIYPILPTSLGLRVHSASDRNEHQKQKNNNVSGE